MCLDRPVRYIAVLACGFLVAGCAGTGADRPDSTSYGNFLVLGIAENYTNRAYYEREVAGELRGLGASATPYYEAAGGNTPIDREAVRALVLAGNYDALLVTRILDRSTDVELQQGSVAGTATRRSGGPFDLFRYDYAELDEPGRLTIEADVTIAGELYDSRSEELVWTTELSVSGSDNIGELIEDTAAAVVRRLDRDKRVTR